MILSILVSISQVALIKDTYSKCAKPLRKNYKGIKHSFRKTFKKLFGESRKKKKQYEASSKFITDKMLSDMSSSEESDSGY